MLPRSLINRLESATSPSSCRILSRMSSWGKAVAISIPLGSDCATGGSAVNDTSGEWNESVLVSDSGCVRVDSDVRGVDEESGGESCCVTGDCEMYSGAFPASVTGTRCSFAASVGGVCPFRIAVLRFRLINQGDDCFESRMRLAFH